MIIEMRTYTLQPGTLAEVEKRFGEALPVREKHSKLEIGRASCRERV